MSRQVFDRTVVVALGTVALGFFAAAAAEEPIPSKILPDPQELPQRYDQPDRAALYYAAQRMPKEGSVDPAKIYAKARQRMARLPAYSTRLGGGIPAKAELGTWELLGPGNHGGRTRALLIHPQKPRIRYAAGVSGGIWKTEDGGQWWRPLADLMPNIAVSTMAMDPSDPETIYAGTGEGHFREVVRETSLPLRGAGIWKTTDGGLTWRRLDATRDRHFRWVNDVVVSHGKARRVYAATRTGVWRSLNAGRTWARILDPQVTGGCFDLALRSDRPNTSPVPTAAVSTPSSAPSAPAPRGAGKR